MPDRTGIFLGWSANLSNFLGLGVEAGASPMYPQKMRVPPLGGSHSSSRCSVGKFPVKPSCPEGDNQTIEICRCRNNLIGSSIIDILLASPMGFDPHVAGS